ncbi:MAG: deoxyribonuclease IV [Sphaerochaeta sp.]|jgi:deoxyribonuclease-4|uniref:deoxyribonuclease IV n=1 Tax=unclassified Sphaerochaeta TaxID=2637943 RepID=UPI0025DA27FC|nr:MULTISPECIES: deoxyribonuclease IV [unclassified Sphaerochaeta]MDX9823726.1 deoxyribonuclease IV [Sphaerochaeta sp.]
MHTIGPHTSIAGGLQNALISAHELGANALGMFTKNQRQWKAKPLDPEEIALFVKTCESLDFSSSQILVHDSYLINLANPDSVKRRQSLDAFIDELKRVEQLGLKLLNFHPGSHLNQVDAREGLRLVAESLDIALSETGNAIAVIENTAGQGSNLGSNFEELAYLYEQCRTQERVGFCIDTCHAHAAGYNLGSIEEFEKAIARFDTLIGLDKLRGMHLNDAKEPAASRLDRHESLGKGTIGWPTFEHIASDRRFEHIPLVLETIDTELWKAEVSRLRWGTP